MERVDALASDIVPANTDEESAANLTVTIFTENEITDSTDAIAAEITHAAKTAAKKSKTNKPAKNGSTEVHHGGTKAGPPSPVQKFETLRETESSNMARLLANDIRILLENDTDFMDEAVVQTKKSKKRKIVEPSTEIGANEKNVDPSNKPRRKDGSKTKRVCGDCGAEGGCEHLPLRKDHERINGSGFCEHGRRKRDCRFCGGSGVCNHGRRRRQCKECGGSGICEHGRRMRDCKDCGGNGVCEHFALKRTCRECKGVGILDDTKGRNAKPYKKRRVVEPEGLERKEGGEEYEENKEAKEQDPTKKRNATSKPKRIQWICEHSRRKADCRDCGGSGTCEHFRLRRDCRFCGGIGICEHGRRKRQCKDCGGSGVCEHGRRRSDCKECGGGGVCEHSVLRRYCKVCGGSGICEHGRPKGRCVSCGGANVCEHLRLKKDCRDCGGSGICEHGKRLRKCTLCGGAGKEDTPNGKKRGRKGKQRSSDLAIVV